MPLILVLVLQFVQGLMIGIANVIPGVSGGTVAVVMGIYDRLIGALSGFFKEKRWKSDGIFLLTILAGVLGGILLFSRVIIWLQASIPEQTQYLFAGLILGSLPFLVGLAGSRKFKPVYLIPLLLTFSVMILQALFQRPEAQEILRELSWVQAPGLFLAGILSASAMVIPGVSGSFLLILLGYYETFIHGIKDLNVPILLVVGAGILVGIVLISKVLNFLLTRFHSWTYYGIIGLVAGSVVDLIVRSREPVFLAQSQALVGEFSLPLNLALLALGALAALLLSGKKKQKARDDRGLDGENSQ